MPIVSNPTSGSGFGRNQFMDMPITERGANWFDDFGRLEPNINNAGWEYRTRWTDPKIEFGIDNGNYMYLKNIDNSGVAAATGVLSEAAVWKAKYGQSPYKPPVGMKMRLDGVQATGNGVFSSIGMCNINRSAALGQHFCALFNVNTNVVGRQFYVCNTVNSSEADTDDIGNYIPGVKLDLTITLLQDEFILYTIKPDSTNVVTSYKSKLKWAANIPYAFVMDCSLSEQNSSIRVSRLGIEYF